MATKLKNFEYAFTKGGDFVLAQVPRCLLVFTREDWLKAIRRGRAFKRAKEHHRRAKAAGPTIQ